MSFEVSSGFEISGRDLAVMLRDALIEKGLVAPLGHPIREKFSWRFSIEKAKEGTDCGGYELKVERYENEKEPKPYEAGDWRDPEVDKIIDENN